MKPLSGSVCCELCENEARMYCESDQARLCFDCDRKVHAANFLVAKHCRTLLCHLCKGLTPWKAAGSNLGSVVSLCHTCVTLKSNPRVSIKAGEEDEGKMVRSREPVREEDDDDEEEDEESCAEIEEDEDEDENQVVPWTRPTPSSSSGDEESDRGAGAGTLKRAREVGIRQSDDDADDADDHNKTLSTALRHHRTLDTVEDEATSFRFMGLSKHRRVTLQV